LFIQDNYSEISRINAIREGEKRMKGTACELAFRMDIKIITIGFLLRGTNKKLSIPLLPPELGKRGEKEEKSVYDRSSH